MDWLQVFTICASIIGVCLWVHREHKEDRKEHKEDMKQLKQNMNDLGAQLTSSSKDFASSSKDFHGRLCALEEKYIQMMQRFMEQRKK